MRKRLIAAFLLLLGLLLLWLLQPSSAHGLTYLTSFQGEESSISWEPMEDTSLGAEVGLYAVLGYFLGTTALGIHLLSARRRNLITLQLTNPQSH
jgi:hypothetical protein